MSDYTANDMPDTKALAQQRVVESLHWIEYEPDPDQPDLLAFVTHNRHRVLVFDFYRGRP
jgi:hypothetical protein